MKHNGMSPSPKKPT